MRSSRLEPGVFWTGSNDGPVWMTRDNGKTWKNVTPTDLPPGGRVHTIEDSPHRKGSAYVSVYRMYLDDFKPYLYMTNDYGAHWTLLDRRQQRHPRRSADARRARGSGAGRAAVRRHARRRVRLVRSGQALADAAAESAGDAGDRHQGPPRRSRRSTMGRSFWIMDNIAPLRQIAASVTKPTRARTTDSPNGQVGQWGRPLRLPMTSLHCLDADTRAAPQKRRSPHHRPAGQGPAIKPFDGSNVFLFTPIVGLPHALRGVVRASRSSGVSAGRARASTTTSPAPRAK